MPVTEATGYDWEAARRWRERRLPGLLIGGAWQPARSGRTSPVFDPSTGSEVAGCAIADVDDVSDAVAAAAAAQPAWEALGLHGRLAYLDALRREIRAAHDTLVATEVLDVGMTTSGAVNDLRSVLRALQLWPGMALAAQGQSFVGGDSWHVTRPRPYGVVVRIVAFNHPFSFAVKGSAAPLLAGNTIVLKAPEVAPMSAQWLGDLVREALPPGVFNIVTGDVATGVALTQDPRVRRIAFTGSTATGLRVQQQAAAGQVRHVSLELGGKNAMIVYPDVDARRVARTVVRGLNLTSVQGQSCGSTSRLFVHADRVEEFTEELISTFRGLRVGPSFEQDTDVGPLVSADHRDRVSGYVEGARGAGVSIHVADDQVPTSGGYYVAPTVLTGVAPHAPVACEEVFGPVVCVWPWNDRDSMLQQVNAVEYGLTASIWTNDLTEALRTADQVEAGYVWVNDSTTHRFGTPFGGVKNSGLGREECLEEYASYLQGKAVHVHHGPDEQEMR